MVVSNIFYFHPYLGKIPILTNIFQLDWNHQPVLVGMFWSAWVFLSFSQPRQWHLFFRMLKLSKNTWAVSKGHGKPLFVVPMGLYNPVILVWEATRIPTNQDSMESQPRVLLPLFTWTCFGLKGILTDSLVSFGNDELATETWNFASEPKVLVWFQTMRRMYGRFTY